MTQPLDKDREGDWSVSRSLQLDRPVDQRGAERISGLLVQMPGVISVRVRAGQRKVAVCYNLARCQYGALARHLSDLGYGVDRGFPFRVKAAVYRLLDDNGRENAGRPEGACCNRPPPGRR
jgi:hypothetical protein